MAYVLVVITVFTIQNAVNAQTRFQAFDNREACERAAEGIRDWIQTFRAAVGRHVFVACYPKG